VLATIASYIVNLNPELDAKGVPKYRISILKNVPSGLPNPEVPSIASDLFIQSIPKLFAIALATILEHIAISKAFARKNRYQIDANQELLALGSANITASFFGAYTVTGSFSRSAVKFQCGVRSPFAGFVTGALILLALYFLTPAFFWIPDAALSAVIMVAVSALIAPPSVFYGFFKLNLWDFLSSQVALWVTIFVSVETGIASGVAFSLLVVLFRVARPNFNQLHQVKGRPDVFIDPNVDPTFETVPAPHGILVFRPEESAIFPNAEVFQNWVVDEVQKYTRFGGRIKPVVERLWSDDQEVRIRSIRKLAHGPDSNVTDDDLPSLRGVVLDFAAVNNIDSTGLHGLFELRESLKDYAGSNDYPEIFFEVHFVNVNSTVLRIIDASGITRPSAPLGVHRLKSVEVLQEVDTNKIEALDSAQPTVALDGPSPFLKEHGLVHLTVREAIDAILLRYQAWNKNVDSPDDANPSSDSDLSTHKDKAEAYV
ncbi:hypothetical protein BGZ94_001645, partial [Podila epigama]